MGSLNEEATKTRRSTRRTKKTNFHKKNNSRMYNSNNMTRSASLGPIDRANMYSAIRFLKINGMSTDWEVRTGADKLKYHSSAPIRYSTLPKFQSRFYR